MACQITAVGELLAALAAPVTLLAHMNRPEVHIQIRCLVERFAAQFAYVILAARVRARMADQFGERPKRPIALLALVVLNARVDALVCFQVTGRSEQFAAQFTLIRSFAGVNT